MKIISTTKIGRKGMCFLVIEGLNRFLSLKLTTLARSFTYIPAKKKLGMFFCLPLSYSKSKNNTLWENSWFLFYSFFLIC